MKLITAHLTIDIIFSIDYFLSNLSEKKNIEM